MIYHNTVLPPMVFVCRAMAYQGRSHTQVSLDLSIAAVSVLEYCKTCHVSRNFRESPEIVHDLQVSWKCSKISRNLWNLIDILVFCNKACFWCESERFLM